MLSPKKISDPKLEDLNRGVENAFFDEETRFQRIFARINREGSATNLNASVDTDLNDRIATMLEKREKHLALKQDLALECSLSSNRKKLALKHLFELCVEAYRRPKHLYMLAAFLQFLDIAKDLRIQIEQAADAINRETVLAEFHITSMEKKSIFGVYKNFKAPNHLNKAVYKKICKDLWATYLQDLIPDFKPNTPGSASRANGKPSAGTQTHGHDRDTVAQVLHLP